MPVDLAVSGCCRLKLCGEPLFIAADGRAVAIEPKDALLLAYLAIEGPTPRARLATLLWPDIGREQARANLRQRLLRLRRATGVELLRAGEVTALREDLLTDMLPATAAARVQREGGGAGDDGGADAFAPLLGATSWSGAGDDAAHWIRRAREMHLARWAERTAAACDALEARGELAVALKCAQRLVAAQPVAEHAHRRLMRLHHLRGDRAAALAAYERCVRLLDEEIGSVPSAETRALARQIDAEADAPTAAPRAVPVTILRPPRLIGRQAQWETLQGAWDRNGAVLVLGDAGMGKTRLVGDFATSRPGVRTVSARPGDADAPYALLSRLLQALLPALPPTPATGAAPLSDGDARELARLLPSLGAAPDAPTDPEAGQVRLLNAVQALFERVTDATSPARVTGLVLDDLHFADSASVEAIQGLIAADALVRWVIASRPAERAPAAQALCDTLLRGEVAIEVRLPPLSEVEVQALIASLAIDGLDAAALAPRLTRHSGGNPLYLLETLKALVLQPARGVRDDARLPVAGTVTDLIQRRILRLGADAIRLARCAAVTGQDFSGELAAVVLGVRPLDMADAWNELEAAQVFRGGAFAHDLIREAALASVPAPIATLLHGQIARYLEAGGHAAARVAQHWLDAGEPARGADALLRAADEAGRVMRLHEKADLLARAADVLKSLGERHRCHDTLLELQRVYAAVGTLRQRDEVYAALLEVVDTDAQRAAAVVERLSALFNGGRHHEAVILAERAIEQAVADHSGAALVAELRTRLGAMLSLMGRLDEAERQLMLAQPAMREHPDPLVRASFFGDLGGFLDNAGRHREARQAHQAAIEGARAGNDIALMVDIHGNLGISFMDSGLHRLAADALQEALRLRQAHAVPTAGAFLQLTLGQVQRSIGRYGAALENTEAQRARWREEHVPLASLCDHGLAQIHLHLGQFARARRELQASVVDPGLPAAVRGKFQLVRARVAWALGQAPQPALLAADALIGDDQRHSPAWRQLQLDWALASEPDEALARARAALALAQAGEQYGTQISAHTRCADACLRGGDPLAAAMHAQQALDLLAMYDPDDLYRAEVGWTAWRSLRAAGAQGTQAILAQTVDWVLQVERTQVPEPFRASFRTRNPINRDLLTAAGRTGAG